LQLDLWWFEKVAKEEEEALPSLYRILPHVMVLYQDVGLACGEHLAIIFLWSQSFSSSNPLVLLHVQIAHAVIEWIVYLSSCFSQNQFLFLYLGINQEEMLDSATE
jgi:hypothetical protein